MIIPEKEEDLFPPVKEYLEHQGYTVFSEVKNCDIVARKDDEVLIIELKRNISLKLLIQAAKRKELVDSVYIAVPVKKDKHYPGSDPDIKALLRQLEIGLILIRMLEKKMRIEVAFHPLVHSKRKKHARQRALLREIDGRYAEFNYGGEPSKKEKITAYKQEALRIASLLSENKFMSPRELRESGCSEKTQRILSKNVYGWFERIERGVYTLHPAGKEALLMYAEIVQKILKSKG